MARDYKHRATSRKRRKAVSPWLGVTVGLLVGLFVAFLVYIKMLAPKSPGEISATTTVAPPATPEEVRQGNDMQTPQPPKPRFVTEVRKLMLGGQTCDSEEGCAPVILICRSGKRSAEAGRALLDAGETKEVSVQTERLTTVVRMLTDEYFVALAVEPGGNVGKARYLLRTSAPTLIENL